MYILIDGYNLMLATGMIADMSASRILLVGRKRLIDWLAKHLDDEQRSQTTIVFDAKNAPAGQDNRYRENGMTVLFATEYEEADDLIEELIRKHSSPKKLTVVSSDNRIKTAAARRRCLSTESLTWYEQVMNAIEDQASTESKSKTDDAAIPDEKEFLKPAVSDFQFDLDEVDWDAIENHGEPFGKKDRSNEESEEEPFNPFPPGYGDDLME